MFQILIVDDDKNLKRALSLLLTDSGYRTFSAGSAREALHTLEKCRIDLMVLEAALPGMDGLALTKLLRDCKNDLPILMLSSRKQPADIKKGFLAGLDDYVTKPFDSEELTLRIKALLRRAKIVSEHQLVIGKTTLDYDTFSVTTDGREQILPQKEFCLLYKLLSYPNQVFTRLQLMDDIWGPSSESTPATVSVHINRLRNRFRNAEDFSIVTIRGLGYKAQIKKFPAI